MSTDPDSPQEVSDSEASKQPDQGDKSIDQNRILRWARRIRNRRTSKQPTQHNQRINKNYILRQIYRTKQNTNSPPKLIVLSPHFNEKHHGIYAETLEQAVLNPKVRNIALTGGYGTGKSSVIQGLIERIHSSKELKKIRPITLSLPTIQIADDSDSEGNRTDRIQRDIVKQLLYRSNPRKMRGSQYRRITHITTVQRTTACFIVAAILTFIFWLLAKPDWHWHWSQGGSLWGYWQPAMVQAILWGLTFYVDWMWVNKPALKGLQLGPAKLELEKNDSSYFDKYLNEIIYYFEVSRTNLVIFEDLDRFDDPYIFDALHELNELINISLGQERFIEQKNPFVKFLYATRDSIFEHKTKGILEDSNARYSHQLEIENRTKFFDVIVPIIPFSTSRNAYECLTQLLDDSDFPVKIEIERKLREIVGSEISDYRLLANIVSEFQIFTKRILASWGGNKEAEEFLKYHANHLFAFIVYKNTHLTDYEKIQKGNSNIDRINAEFSQMIIDIHKVIKELFNSLGEKLRDYIHKKVNINNYQLVLVKDKFNNCNEIGLWTQGVSRAFFTKTISLINSSEEEIGTIDASILVKIMTDELKKRDSESFPKEEPLNYLERITNGISQIVVLPNNYFILLNKNLTLPNEIQRLINRSVESITELLNHDSITQTLIENNYINKNFHLYSSVFIGRYSSIKAVQFLIRNVGEGKPNVTLSLNSQDLEEITYQLRCNWKQYPSLIGALNADLMRYLESQFDYHILFRILNDAEIFFKIQPLIDKYSIKLASKILQPVNNFAGADYKISRELFRKIISQYPDIFLEIFKENLTIEHKILLIDSALYGNVKTSSEIKESIKIDDEKIISGLQKIHKVDCGEIRKRINESLGLNPFISFRYKETLKRMLMAKCLTGISEQEINQLERLDQVPEIAKYFDPRKKKWIPLQNATKFVLDYL